MSSAFLRVLCQAALFIGVATGTAVAQQAPPPGSAPNLPPSPAGATTAPLPAVLQNRPSEPVLRKPPLLGLKYIDNGAPNRSLVGNFPACDGYRQPCGSSDGFITEKDLLGLFNMTDDIRQAWGLTLGADGIGYCDAALADPALTDKMSVRRVNLMQAKALHQMVAGDNAGALVTLDNARALKFDLPDALRADGFDIANSAETALALIRLGRSSEAVAIIDRIEKQRPYAVAVLALADALRSSAAPSLDAAIAQARARGAIEPNVAFRGINLAMLSRRMDDVVYLGEGLTLALPDTGRWNVDGQNQAKYTFISNRAMLAGMVAYAEAAKGSEELAAARIKAARALLAQEDTPPPAANGEPISKRKQRDFELRTSWATQGGGFLDAWEKTIALRRQAPTLSPTEVLTQARGIANFPGLAMPDLIAHARVAGPNDEAAVTALYGVVRTKITDSLAKQAVVDPQDFLKMLPRPEVPKNQVTDSRYNGLRCSLPECARAGGEFELDELDLPNRVSVRFASNVGTTPTVQEYSILMAANVARAKGFDSFIIEYARTVNRTQNMMQYGRIVSAGNAGRESELVVRLINKAAPPEDMQGAEWRAFSAAKVLADFAARPGGGGPAPLTR